MQIDDLGGAPAADDSPSRRHRRPADFVVRLAPYPSGAPGRAMAVTVDMDQAYFFDEQGERIDVGWR